MSEYRRTAIRRLSIRRYRSLSDVVLDNLPEIIVLYGPNGAGKSNILRAVQLLLRAAPWAVAAVNREAATSFQLADAHRLLDLRPDDFRFDDLPESRISMTVDLGTRAREIVLPPSGRELSRLDLEAVFQLESDKAIRLWFERADIDGIPISAPDNAAIAARVQRLLIPCLLQVSEAYRVPGASDDPQSVLYQAFLSEDRRERDAAQRLSQRLARAGLFGAPKGGIALIPVDSRTYGERQIRFKHPTHGELPLRNLGSGEQQVVFMLGQRVITPFPIAHIEEPEAHLHKTLMEPLAQVLRESVLGDGGTPDVDQLWMATHHHYFAIADEFFDVSLDDQGSTNIAPKKRDLAAVHFYEPSPYWDTLRGLVESGMSPETIVSLDAHGQPIRAKDVLESIKGDRRVANEFVEAATKAFVLSLTRDESEK